MVTSILSTSLLNWQYSSQDEEWAEEDNANQGFKEDEFAYLSEMIGPKGVAFDNDEILDGNDDEDLKNDPVSQMDMQASTLYHHELQMLIFWYSV